jgi:type IV pilus assembly protein PilB
MTLSQETLGAAPAKANGNGKRTPVKRIGDIIVDLGYATKEQIEEAVRSEQDAGLQLGARLLHKGTITEAQLAHALSVRLGVEFADLARLSDINAEAVAAVPERVARRYLLIPTHLEENVLSVAMVSPGNVFAIDAVRTASGFEVKPIAAPERAIRQAIDRCYGFGSDLETTVSELASAELLDVSEEPESLDVGQLRNEAEDAPVVKYVDSLISHAIRDRASDIHIEPARDSVTVRVRVDGKLRNTIAPPKSMQNAVISRIKILSNLDIAEKRLPLDGRLRARIQGREVDLRVSTMPTIHGEKVVLRVLDKTAVKLDLDKIGGEVNFQEHLKHVLRRNTGMILVTGPTGSGKTTTLYAALNHVRDITKNVISVEDPVEYEIDGVTQIHARPEIGMTFARALRSILRQDPDVIMVGEMRDLETLEIGIRASLTGHLVLSTIHTNDAVSTVTRMINMGAEPYLIASTMITSIAQRLVRTICPECREEYDPPAAQRAKAEKALDAALPARLVRGKGCTLCADTGFYGRTAVFEYFKIDDTVRDRIAGNASEVELRSLLASQESGNLLRNALNKVLQGITTLDEALQLEMTI